MTGQGAFICDVCGNKTDSVSKLETKPNCWHCPACRDKRLAAYPVKPFKLIKKKNNE